MNLYVMYVICIYYHASDFYMGVVLNSQVIFVLFNIFGYFCFVLLVMRYVIHLKRKWLIS